MAGHPLRPATRRRLGEPLPHQLADRARAPPPAHLCFNLSAYGVLASASRRCPPLKDSFSCCTHPSATPYAIPCYHFMTPSSNLHVLRTPPAFILSQDQTLSRNYCESTDSYFKKAQQKPRVTPQPSLHLNISPVIPLSRCKNLNPCCYRFLVCRAALQRRNGEYYTPFRKSVKAFFKPVVVL